MVKKFWLDECDFFFGEAQEIERIYRSFWKHSTYNSSHCERAIFAKDGRFYGLRIDHEEKTFTVLGESTACYLLIRYFTPEEAWL